MERREGREGGRKKERNVNEEGMRGYGVEEEIK